MSESFTMQMKYSKEFKNVKKKCNTENIYSNTAEIEKYHPMKQVSDYPDVACFPIVKFIYSEKATNFANSPPYFCLM